MRILFDHLRPAILSLAVLLAPAAVLAVDDSTAEASDAEEAAESDNDRPAGRASDTVFVRESLPFVPASNTIATKLPTETAWTPANVGIVDLALIDQQNSRVLGDALGNVSGLNIQTQNGVVDFFVVRGFDSVTSSLVLTDGAPEPEASFYQLYNTERVEVFKGPAGFLYGSNPLAGVVNLVRKQPAPARFGSAGLSYGSHETAEATFDWNQGSESGTLDFRLNGFGRSSDGYRDGRESDAWAINPALAWRPDESSLLSLNFEVATSDYTPDAGLPLFFGELPPVDRDLSYASSLDKSDQDILRFQADYERQISSRFWLRNKTYFRSLDWATNGTLLNGVVPQLDNSFSVFRTLVLLDDKQEFFGNQLELGWSGETGGVQHDLLFGLEAGIYADDFGLDVGILPSVDLFDPQEPPGFGVFLLPDQSMVGDTETQVVAPYVVDQITVSDRLRFLVGARLDLIDFEDSATGTSRDDSEVSPIFGAVFSPAPDLVVYANAAESFAPPSPRVVGERKPEESRQIELGLRKQFAGGRVRTTFALYQLERDNIPIPDDNGFTQQQGDQEAQGFEAEVAAELGGGVRGVLAYAYTDSELTNFRELVVIPFPVPQVQILDHSGNDSPFAPESLLNLWLSGPVAKGWTLGGGVRFVDDQFIAEDNSFAIDSYALLDASLSYAHDDWRWSLHLDNLTDEDYETRGFGSTSVIPGAPLSAYFSVDFRF